MNTLKVRSILYDYLILTIGCFLFAFAWEGFMIPNNMSSGGLVGLCTVIQYATAGFIQVQFSYIAINAFLILLSIFIFGIGFGFRTIYCILVSTLMMQVIAGIPALHADPGRFFYVEHELLVPIIGGILESCGIGLILRKGGSSGGTDIIALVANKYWPVSLSKVFLATDFIIICSLLFLPDKSFNDMCYGFEMMVTFSLVIDVVVAGQKNSLQLMVFSEKFSEIADHIINRMDRGVTVLKAMGWYTKSEKNVLLILISKKQLPELSKTIKEIDPRAFMSISNVSNVYGEGFDEIKGGIKRKKK